MMIKALKIIGLAVAMFLTILIFNTLTFSSKQIDVASIERLDVDDSVVIRFQNALQFPTISNMDSGDFDSIPFQNQILFVANNYPLVDSLLELNIVGNYSLLFKWEGSNNQELPVLVYSHYDVVPVDSSTFNDWEAPPFSGEVIDENIYGRGALDDKSGVFATLEAIETLLMQGYKPSRTLYFGFGHDEEIGGDHGAGSIVSYLEQQDVRLEYSLDEGIPVLEGMVPGISKLVSFIGTAEKGYVSYRLTINTEGGHSSSPTPDNTIGSLAKAIVKLEENQFDYQLKNPIDQQLAYIGPEMPFITKMFFANTWLFGGTILKGLNAHTTTAATIIGGGMKDNVIPTTASVVVNFRIMPGETVDDVYNHIKETIEDERLTIDMLEEGGNNPSPVSSIESKGFKTIDRTIREVYGDIIVSPGLVPGGTDSKHFAKISDNCYRFNPARITSENRSGFHGINEYISVESYKDAIRFYHQLIQNIGDVN